MKYQAYEEYKDSGVEWLGSIPVSWHALSIKRISEIFNGATPKSGEKAYWDGDVSWVTPADLGKTTSPFISSGARSITIEGFDSCGTSLVPVGTILLSSRAPIGTLGIAANDLCTNQGCKSLVVDKMFYSKYLYYVLLSSTKQLNLLGRGTTFLELSSDELGGYKIGFPPKGEQQKITNFLDHETAKIDTLIEKQQQLIKLLKEKRQAVISHAVTKGLNPNASMRDSGVEWLGEVPEHWEVSKFGYISQVVRGGSPRPAGDPTLFNGDYSPWVTVAEITKDDEIYLTETETFLTKNGSDQCRVFSTGTLLLSNSGATLGVPSILQINANANDGVVGFENLKLNHEFAYFYLSILTDGLRERIKQGSGQPNLNTDIVKDIFIPIPSNREMEEIVLSIHKTREQYKKLTEKATIGIELLQERRTALISAAVTGKIDVRNWQPSHD